MKVCYLEKKEERKEKKNWIGVRSIDVICRLLLPHPPLSVVKRATNCREGKGGGEGVNEPTKVAEKL